MHPRSRPLRSIALAALLVPALAGAQEWYGGGSPFGHVRASSGVTGAFAPGDPNSYGFGGLFEPKANIVDQFAVGARFEAAVLGGLDATNPAAVVVSARMIFGGMVKGELSLLPGEVRPFVGAGLGWYAAVVLAGGLSSGTSGFAGNGPGVMPQVGVDLGWLRVAAQYHLLFGALGAASLFALELSWRVY